MTVHRLEVATQDPTADAVVDDRIDVTAIDDTGTCQLPAPCPP